MAVSVNRKSQYDEGSLDQYLRDISVYPLITREEEVTLAQRIRTNDQEALDKLVRSNLRFVVSVAKKYQNQGVSLSDLINEATSGSFAQRTNSTRQKASSSSRTRCGGFARASFRLWLSSRESFAFPSTARARCTG